MRPPSTVKPSSCQGQGAPPTTSSAIEADVLGGGADRRGVGSGTR
jgi:hypothetical protein